MPKITFRKIVKWCLPYGILLLARKYVTKKSAKLRLKQRKTLHLSIHLVDHCNLNCKGCDNFSCIADEKYHSVESLERDFNRIYELANGKIDSISLLGGEPLLHPELERILDTAGKYFGKIDLRLVTNGVLLSKQKDSFWESCHKNNVKVTITKYPINVPFAKLEQTAKEHKVILEYYGDTGVTLKTMHKMPINPNGNENPRKSFALCYKANTCIMLDEGKIYTCATIPYIKYFNKQFGMNLKICDKDYIDIYEIRDIDAVFEFLCKPMPFCRYCNTKEPVYGINWGSIKKRNFRMDISPSAANATEINSVYNRTMMCRLKRRLTPKPSPKTGRGMKPAGGLAGNARRGRLAKELPQCYAELMAQSEKTHPNRRYKDSFFVSLFIDERLALRLYGAITGRTYGADTRIAVIGGIILKGCG